MLSYIAVFAGSLLLSQTTTTPIDLAPSVAPLIDRVKASVVTIQSTKMIPRVSHEDPMEHFFRQRMGLGRSQARQKLQRGLGSGFITNRSGIVLTNNHVVAGADEVWVLLSDGRRLESRVVGSDPSTDVAVVRINRPPSDLKTVVLGNSDAVRVGDYVLAIGNPLGLGQTVTMGIVSAKNRNLGGKIVQYEDFIQTDAAINQGNSGGPLFNFKGEVVGINSAILNPAMAMNVGFAIPINLARQIAEQIEKTGGVARGYLGVGTEDLTPIKARRLGLSSDFGALVNMVTPGSPAAQAGILPNDVIQEVSGRQVESSSGLQRIIQARAPGEVVNVLVLRGQKKLSLKLRLKENVAMLGTRVLGMQLDPISESEAAELGSPGFKVTYIDRRSPASSHLQTGDILTHIIFRNGQPKPASPVVLKQLEQRLAQGAGGRIVFLRDGYRLVLTLE